jgi:uncharacterized protein (TIGR03435 family)
MRNAFLALLTLAASLCAQTFDVATVKPAEAPVPGERMMIGIAGGPGTRDPGQISANATLSMLLMTAYDVKAYQITGPPWLNMERYQIMAKVPAGATKDQVRVMWQNLLAERFGLTLHHQSKIFQVEQMEIAKAGKLKESTLDPNAPEAQPALAGPFSPPKMDKNGVPELSAPGLIMMMRMGPAGPSAHMVGKAQTAAQLAGMVANELDRPVVDKTGLTGKYDFVLEFAPDPSRIRLPPGGAPPPVPGAPGPVPGGDANGTDPSGLTIVGALQQQLGLRLVSTRAPLDTLIIDHAEKVPTEN